MASSAINNIKRGPSPPPSPPSSNSSSGGGGSGSGSGSLHVAGRRRTRVWTEQPLAIGLEDSNATSAGGASSFDAAAAVLVAADESSIMSLTSRTSALTLGSGLADADGGNNNNNLNADSSSSELLRSFSKRRRSSAGADGLPSEERRTLKPAAFRQSKIRSERALPVSRLRFSALGLVGRDSEIELLKGCLDRVAGGGGGGGGGGSRELVLVSGEAGTGKTALASSLAKSVNRRRGLFVKGKFDLQYLRDNEKPYSGIAAACREVCGAVLFLRDDGGDSQQLFDKIRNELVELLGPGNICLLINVIPELAEIVGDDVIMMEEDGGSTAIKKQKTAGKGGASTTGGGEAAKARFSYAFRVLIRIVAAHFKPLVVLLDDLQWVDAAALDLLRVLVADQDNRSGLMVIGTYRPDEVAAAGGGKSHPLPPLISEMKRAASPPSASSSSSETRDNFNVTELEIGNLSVSQVNEFIVGLLSVDDQDETLELADLCHKRTLGNAFSLVVFLEMLQTEGLLQYSLGKFEWGWSENRILSETAATSNVVDLMQRKIEKLPASAGQRLSIAACLGSSLERAVLGTVWTSITSEQQSTTDEDPASEPSEDDDIGSFLALVEQEGFLEAVPGSESAYRWVHDKVQEAAMSLVPADELPGLMARVGKILVDELHGKDLDSYIFTVVSLLHGEKMAEDEAGQVQLAELSLRASKKAEEQSAFECADKYAAIGVSALPKNKWSDHYELTLDLYSTSAEAACCLGKIDLLEKCYKEVLDQEDRPVVDKLRVYHAMISYMGGAIGKPSDAIELIDTVLPHYKLNFPKRKATRVLSTLSGFLRAKRKMSSLRPEDISNLPLMEDPDHLEAMRLLDQLFMAAYLAKSDLMPLSLFASIRLTLEHGLSKYSAAAFAGLALLVGIASGDMELGSKTGSFAQVAMKKVKCKSMEARAELWLNAFVFCWTEPIARMSPRFLRTYETGLSVGDNENACWCIAQYIVVGFQSGKSLGTVEADCKIYLKQMMMFKRETVHADISIYIEMIRNLMGLSEGNPTVMRSEQRFLSHSDHTVLGVFYTCQSILYLYFGEYEKGAELAIERGDTYAKGVPAHVWIMIETYTRGMLLYAMARMSRNRKYAKHAKKVHKTIKAWVQKGNPNVKHYNLLLNAEAAALSGKLDAAEGWYQSAIVSAARQGHVHESAYAAERYGEFLLTERNDREEARHKIDDAIRRYGDWGAARKVQLLREKYRGLWVKPTEVVFALQGA